jgi:hypothetical protein
MGNKITEHYQLFCDGRLIGQITNVQGLDFPSRVGNFIPAAIDDDVRQVIGWFVAICDADELVDPPFPDHLLWNWWLEYPGGERKQIDVPIIDLVNGTIEWI